MVLARRDRVRTVRTFFAVGCSQGTQGDAWEGCTASKQVCKLPSPLLADGAHHPPSAPPCILALTPSPPSHVPRTHRSLTRTSAPAWRATTTPAARPPCGRSSWAASRWGSCTAATDRCWWFPTPAGLLGRRDNQHRHRGVLDEGSRDAAEQSGRHSSAAPTDYQQVHVLLFSEPAQRYFSI